MQLGRKKVEYTRNQRRYYNGSKSYVNDIMPI